MRACVAGSTQTSTTTWTCRCVTSSFFKYLRASFTTWSGDWEAIYVHPDLRNSYTSSHITRMHSLISFTIYKQIAEHKFSSTGNRSYLLRSRNKECWNFDLFPLRILRLSFRLKNKNKRQRKVHTKLVHYLRKISYATRTLLKRRSTPCQTQYWEFPHIFCN